MCRWGSLSCGNTLEQVKSRWRSVWRWLQLSRMLSTTTQVCFLSSSAGHGYHRRDGRDSGRSPSSRVERSARRAESWTFCHKSKPHWWVVILRALTSVKTELWKWLVRPGNWRFRASAEFVDDQFVLPDVNFGVNQKAFSAVALILLRSLLRWMILKPCHRFSQTCKKAKETKSRQTATFCISSTFWYSAISSAAAWRGLKCHFTLQPQRP